MANENEIDPLTGKKYSEMNESDALRIPGPDANTQRRTDRKKPEPSAPVKATPMKSVVRFFVLELVFNYGEDHLKLLHEELSRFGDSGWSMAGFSRLEIDNRVEAIDDNGSPCSAELNQIRYTIVLQRNEYAAVET